MNRTDSIKNSLTLAFLIFTVCFLVSGNSVAEETESNPVPIHLNLNSLTVKYLEIIRHYPFLRLAEAIKGVSLSDC